MNYDHEKYKNIIKPKTEIKLNKNNLNQKGNESEINNLYINSINEVRLPKGLVDISFDILKAE
jgi:hypothetical protein